MFFKRLMSRPIQQTLGRRLSASQTASILELFRSAPKLQKQGKLNDAIASYELLLKQDAVPTTAKAKCLRALGDCKAALGIADSKTVTTHYKDAIALQNGYALAYFSLGAYYRSQAEFSDARKQLETALLTHPKPLTPLIASRAIAMLNDVKTQASDSKDKTDYGKCGSCEIAFYGSTLLHESRYWQPETTKGEFLKEDNYIGMLETDKISVEIVAPEAGLVTDLAEENNLNMGEHCVDSSKLHLGTLLASRVGTFNTRKTSTKNSSYKNTSATDLAELIKKTHKTGGKVVVITGAGISAGAGLLTRKDLWQHFDRANHVSRWEVNKKPENLWRITRELYRPIAFKEPSPTIAHRALAAMQREGIVSAIITQNVDGLHQSALGSNNNIIEMHGTLLESVCTDCHAVENFDARLLVGKYPDGELNPPLCQQIISTDNEIVYCNGTILPNVVLFGDHVNQQNLQQAYEYIKDAALVLVIGTALDASPSADLPLLSKATKHLGI